MKTKDDWLKTWADGHIPFDRGSANPALEKHFHRLGLKPGGRVFVPLCGAAADMAWLAERKAAVLGVELSGIAVKAFFTRYGEAPKVSKLGKLASHKNGIVEILQGDFFDLEPEHLEGVAAVFDRASLIALAPEDRRRYAAFMQAALKPGTKYLLVTVEYDQREMDGPPYSIGKQEVSELFGRWAAIEPLGGETLKAVPEHLAKKGLKSLSDFSYLIIKN